MASEKLKSMVFDYAVCVCQKSKVGDWLEHFQKYYPEWNVIDYTRSGALIQKGVIIVNYDLIFRRKEFLNLKDVVLICDESGLLTNENAKRTKFIMRMNYKAILLLSGTICGGRYEKLWSQLHLLGWPISKDLYWKQYIDVEVLENEGFPVKVVRGYKNVDRLKSKMRRYGCRFLKTEDVFDLPEQNFQTVHIPATKEYFKFRRSGIIKIQKSTLKEFKSYGDHHGVNLDDIQEFVGDTILKKMLYERQLCGAYNAEKVNAFRDILESTEDRLIVFYNFDAELETLRNIAKKYGRPVSVVNGHEKDLTAYENRPDSVTLIQYQAGAMGLNLQKANKIVYFTPPLSSELFEQSKKRIHRIGQGKPCFYYQLTCRGSVEEKIYKTLEMRKDYTEYLFEERE